MTPHRPLRERFETKIDRTPGHGPHGTCWLWTGGRSSSGYGEIWHNRTNRLAHRIAWQLAQGPIPAGLQVLHRCDVRHCVRPDHLFLGTHDDNMADKVAKGRQASGFRNGHYTKPESTLRGDRHPSRLRPETRPRGETHHSRTKPWTLARGERMGQAKLSDAAVVEMRRRHAAGATTTELGREFGVSRTAASFAVRGLTWKHVTEVS